jgi:carbon storage regulator
MLVLSRKAGQNVRLGGNVVVTVLELGGGRVRLGIEAPRNVAIVRGELAPRREAELERARPYQSVA